MSEPKVGTDAWKTSEHPWSEPMSAERLAEIEAMCQVDAMYWSEAEVLQVPELIAEVRRLQRENQLLHLARGAAPVGMD